MFARFLEIGEKRTKEELLELLNYYVQCLGFFDLMLITFLNNLNLRGGNGLSMINSAGETLWIPL